MTKVYDALSAEDRWIVGSMVLTVTGIVSGAVRRDPRAFGITTIAVIGVLLVGSAVTRSPRFAWLLLFGLVGGILELWADWVHVVYFQSLVYTHDFGVVLLSSPSYMPLGWWLTIVQFGYLALRLSETWSRRSAIGLVTIVGALLPPWYEELAFRAGAWHYRPSPWMLAHTPGWIIFTYAGCAFAIATLAIVFYHPRAWGRAVLAGLFTAGSLMFSSVFWYATMGRR
jgi:hypothetical protein